MTVKTGRPRLDSRDGFYEDFCRVLPRLQAGAINYSQAARELRISVRSLKQYLEIQAYKAKTAPLWASHRFRAPESGKVLSSLFQKFPL